jgi:endonuclease/exonuclease/phosphatase family metal-dependent hydrolase
VATDAAAVGTFNIEWFGSDGPKAGRSDADIEAIAGVIQQTGASLLGLQEIGDEETMDRLLRHLPGWRYVMGTSGRGQRCAMLWDSSRASVGRAAEWPDVNDNLERSEGNLRAPLVAQARVGEFDFLFVVVHLKAMFDEKSIRTRREQCRRLRARLDEWVAGHDDKDVLVVGDFNDLPGSPAMNELTGRGGGGAGFIAADARLPESVGTYLGRSGRIDHLLLSSPHVSQEEWTGDVAVFPKPRGAARRAYEAAVSDHLPSWATFRTDRDNDP